MNGERPPYDPLQAAFHRAFRPELYRLIDRLPAPAGAHVLDAPCGDGFYSRRLARSAGQLVALDADAGYLELARGRLGERATVVPGDVYALPFPSDTFDLVWCGQSLISLDEPARALGEFARVTRPGGLIAVFESDEFHHVLLPWPVGLDVAVQAALLEGSREKYGDGGKLAQPRTVRAHLLAAGLTDVRRRTVAADRHAPFARPDRVFLKRHLEFWRTMVYPRLPAGERARFDRFTMGTGGTSIFRSAAAEFTCLTTVHLGRKPGDQASSSRSSRDRSNA